MGQRIRQAHAKAEILMTRYADLFELHEDDRIKLIGETALAGNIIGVAIDDDRVKIKRYIKKLKKRFPTVRHLATKPGIVPGTRLLQFGPPADH